MDATPRRTATSQVDTPNIMPTSRAETFVDTLPILILDLLPEDHRNCPVCLERYSQQSEQPIRVPCGHIIGKNCLLTWLQSAPRNANNNTNKCPICRAVLFEHEVDEDTIIANGYTRRVQEDLDRLLDAIILAPRMSQEARTAALERFNQSNTAMVDAIARGTASAQAAANQTSSNQVRDRALDWIGRRDLTLSMIVARGRRRAGEIVQLAQRAEERITRGEELYQSIATTRELLEEGRGAWTPTVAPNILGHREYVREPESLGRGIATASEVAAGGRLDADRAASRRGLEESVEQTLARYRALVDDTADASDETWAGRRPRTAGPRWRDENGETLTRHRTLLDDIWNAGPSAETFEDVMERARAQGSEDAAIGINRISAARDPGRVPMPNRRRNGPWDAIRRNRNLEQVRQRAEQDIEEMQQDIERQQVLENRQRVENERRAERRQGEFLAQDRACPYATANQSPTDQEQGTTSAPRIPIMSPARNLPARDLPATRRSLTSPTDLEQVTTSLPRVPVMSPARNLPTTRRSFADEATSQAPRDAELGRAIELMAGRNVELRSLLTRAEARPWPSVGLTRAVANARDALARSEDAERELAGLLARGGERV